MNPISKQMVQKIIKHWENIIPYTQIPKNETEYEKLLAFIETYSWKYLAKNQAKK